MITLVLNDFNLHRICESGQCFRMTETQPHHFTVIASDHILHAVQDGDKVTFDCCEEEFGTFWRNYFDLDTDYQAFRDRINPNDQYLLQAVESGMGIRILRQDLWEMIVTFLISQQNNIPRIHRCVENICREYGKKIICPDGSFYYAFPTPESLAFLPEDALMACNLGYRSKYVVRTAKAVAAGEINLEKIRHLPYRKAREELLKCFGVGEKVADCICLFALHHLQSFPVDTHIRQVLEEHYKRGFPNRRYQNCRGVMQQYIFYYELQKN